MLIECKRDKEKTAMGLLSYLPDFKNLNNLKDEINLNMTTSEFQLFLYRQQDTNFIGVVGVQNSSKFVIIRYLSLAPGYRSDKFVGGIVKELAENDPDKMITTVPEYTYLTKYLK